MRHIHTADQTAEVSKLLWAFGTPRGCPVMVMPGSSTAAAWWKSSTAECPCWPAPATSCRTAEKNGQIETCSYTFMFFFAMIRSCNTHWRTDALTNRDETTSEDISGMLWHTHKSRNVERERFETVTTLGLKRDAHWLPMRQEFFRFPGYISPSSEIKFTDIPNGLAAATKVPAVGWFQYTVFCGICDLWLMHQVPTNPPGKLCTRLFGEETTNYEYGFLGLPGYLGGKAIADPEIKKKKLNAEIANGRLAMMAIIGGWAQRVLFSPLVFNFFLKSS